MRFLLLVLSALSLSTLPGHAQTTKTPTSPRFYVGLAAYSSYYQLLGGQAQGRTPATRLPVQLTAGYQLHPRLAAQVGVAYSGSSAEYASEGHYYNGTRAQGTYFNCNGTSTQRNVSVAVLARYTLTRHPAHRVQFDALGGFTLEHSNGYNRGTQADSLGGSLIVSSYGYRRTFNTLLLTAGLGTRYRLGQRFELTYDFTLNKALTGSGPGGQFQGLTSGSALGLRYRFGK